MKTFIKTKFKILDDQTNIEKFRLSAKLILQRIIITNFCGPDGHLREVQYRIWNPHRISKTKKKKY